MSSLNYYLFKRSSNNCGLKLFANSTEDINYLRVLTPKLDFSETTSVLSDWNLKSSLAFQCECLNVL